MASRPLPSQSEVERAFADAMSAAGFVPGPVKADTDRFVRFDAPGDKKGKGNGFYKLKTGPYPVGWFGDWKTGESHQWFYHDPDAPPLTDAERAKIKREQARLKAEAAQAREARQAEVAEDASRIWKDADPGGVEGHPYLERKSISIPRGLRLYTAKDGTALLAVPMWAFDMNGTPQLTSLQLIDGNGQKRFLKAGRVEGTFFSLKGDTSIIIICEGVATGFSIWEATGLSVVCAFNSGNLIEVAKEFARHRPLAKIMIAGDDDAIASESWVEMNRQLEDEGKSPRPWVNTGRKKAEAAAKAIGCRWILPLFEDGAARGRTDFNDLHQVQGLKAVGAQVMGAFRSVEAEDTQPGAEIVEIDRLQDESWRSKIPVTSQGSPDGGNVEGVALYIANHKLLKGRIRFNTFTKEMELDGNPIEDYQVAEFRRIMHSERFKARKPDVQDEMVAEGRRNQFDPLLSYLQSLAWDGKERVSSWLTTFLGVEPTRYSMAVGRKFLIGAAARALNAGCKMDTMLVLEGEQGIGKSTALRYLFGDRFFIDHLPDFHSKDSFMQLQGAWCVEVAELSAMSKADVKDVKQFLSRLVDKFRPPYGSATIQVGRRCVFAGTVNPEEESGYLRDPTGARRFWPVTCGAIDLSGLLQQRDQLWAEAVAAYKEHEAWYLTDAEEVSAAKLEQEARREIDPWEQPIARWLYGKSQATVADILDEALKVPAERQDVRARRRIGACMRALKWTVGQERISGQNTKVFNSPKGQRSMWDEED